MKRFPLVVTGLLCIAVVGFTYGRTQDVIGYTVRVTSPGSDTPITFDWTRTIGDLYEARESSGPIETPASVPLPAGEFPAVFRKLSGEGKMLIEVVEILGNGRTRRSSLSVYPVTLVARIRDQVTVAGLPGS